MIDESGFLLQPLCRRTWALAGHTPILEHARRHDRLTAIAALTLTPHRKRIDLFFELLPHNATCDEFVWFRDRLRHELGRPLVVVWDRLGAHRKAARLLTALECDWVQFEWLPSYAPELNPVEHVWSTAKWGDLANRPPEDVTHLERQVAGAFSRQGDCQHLLRSHFQWAKLNLR